MTRWNNLTKEQAKRLGLEGFREIDQMEKKEKRQAVKKMTAKQIKKDIVPIEYDEQVKLAEYLDMKGYCWCHVPNGGNRNVVTGAKLKKQGVKPGVPDVLIFDSPGIAIELKRKKGGRLRKSQKEWLRKLAARNWITNVCHGADEAIDWLEELFKEV